MKVTGNYGDVRFKQFMSALDSLGDEVSTPAPVILIDVVEENIERMQKFADHHGKVLRPHVKTHKSLRIGQMQLAAGAAGLTAGNLSEAEVFAEGGCMDIFLAYPLWVAGANVQRLRKLAQRVHLTVGVESAEAASRLAEAVRGSGKLAVLIEVECGARRSGVSPVSAGALAAHARDLGLAPRGIFTYPGHGGTVGLRETAARDQAKALRTAVASFSEHGIEAEIVSAGSTPTAEFSTDPIITEIRPGEYVFNDHDNVRLEDCKPENIGLFVASTTVSDQGFPHVILDAGTKALAREGSLERGYGQVPSYGGYLSKLNEYHGFLHLPEFGERPKIGEKVAIIPHHVCPVVNSFEELIISNRSGDFLGRWKVDAQGQLNGRFTSKSN